MDRYSNGVCDCGEIISQFAAMCQGCVAAYRKKNAGMDLKISDSGRLDWVMNRATARISGSRHYFTGKPCKRGHLEHRNVSRGNCRACEYTPCPNCSGYKKRHSPLCRSCAARGPRLDQVCASCNGFLKIRYRKQVCTSCHDKRLQLKRDERLRSRKEKIRLRQEDKAMRKARRKVITPEQKRENWKKYSQTEQYRETRRAYLESPKGREMRRAKRRRRRAREKGLLGTFSPDIEARLFEIQAGRCALLTCRKKLSPKRSSYDLDHIMPLALGGLHEDENLQLLCRGCNLAKGSKEPGQWMVGEGLLPLAGPGIMLI